MTTDKPNLYQTVKLTLSDGSSHCFTGPAVVFPGERRTITDVAFTEPKPLPQGCKFEIIEPKPEDKKT